MKDKKMKKQEEEKKKRSQAELQLALQEKYLEYQMIEEQAKKFQEQNEALEKQRSELESLKDAVSEIANTKTGTELFVPMSSGIFIRTEIKDNRQVLMNVGDNVVVPKSVQNAQELIRKQQAEVEGYKEKIQQNLEILTHHLQRIEAELQDLVKEGKEE